MITVQYDILSDITILQNKIILNDKINEVEKEEILIDIENIKRKLLNILDDGK